MPVETCYVDEGRGAHKRAHGILTSTDLLVTGLLQARDVENTSKLKYMIYDCTEVTEVHTGHEVIPQLVEINRKTAELSRGGIIAIVAPNPLIFGMARTWQSLSADLGWKSQIFQDRADAIAWLRKQLGGGDPENPVLEEYPSLKR